MSHVKMLASFYFDGFPTFEFDKVVFAYLITIELHLSILDFDGFEALLN